MPARLAVAERGLGRDHGDLPSAMQLPNETIYQIYEYLAPQDFNAARHTCRTWFLASMRQALLEAMLLRGGWSSSIRKLLYVPSQLYPSTGVDGIWLMSKWISRECALLQDWPGSRKTGFVQVGMTDLSDISSAEAGASFTISACGRFLMVSSGCVIFIYELNHRCKSRKNHWRPPTQALDPNHGNLGTLRPVTAIVCPHQVIACSMDTTNKRYAVAVLMDGRTGMIVNLTKNRVKPGRKDSMFPPSAPRAPGTLREELPGTSAPSICACQDNNLSAPMPIEDGLRSTYGSIGGEEDPPRSIAICPSRECVAFGCYSGIELHWVDTLTGQDFSRWFPLTSPSDWLFFLPPRSGVDNAKKLRLISSTHIEDVASQTQPRPSGTNLLRTASTAVMSMMQTVVVDDERHSQSLNLARVESSAPIQGCTVADRTHARGLIIEDGVSERYLRKFTAQTADHYRAIPISDGHHIMFTDPWTGSLCLGSDAPVGALTRLTRKIEFKPPPTATSTIPLLYACGLDLNHGLRVVATFAVADPGPHAAVSASETMSSTSGADSSAFSCGSSLSKKIPHQAIVFYTAPPDVLIDLERVGADDDGSAANRVQELVYPVSDWVSWWLDNSLQFRATAMRERGVLGPFPTQRICPIEIKGQVVAECDGLVNVGVDAGPEMLIWAFSREGWGRCWKLGVGTEARRRETVVTRDGSMRAVDAEGDVAMPEAWVTPPGLLSLPAYRETLQTACMDGTKLPRWRSSQKARWYRDRMSGTISVDVMDEIAGIGRVDVVLR